jgi:hypothetical protein
MTSPGLLGYWWRCSARQTDQQDRPGFLARISALDQSERTLTLDSFPSEMAGHDEVRLRRVAAFKWSRENGAMAFPIRRIQKESSVVTLENLGNDLTALKEGDWVEVADDDSALLKRSHPLGRIEFIDRTHHQVSLSRLFPCNVEASPEKHPMMLRWDQTRVSVEGEGNAPWLDSDQIQVTLLRDGVLPAYSNVWMGLEDGIQVSFMGNGYYQTGDFWLIPARSLMENVE